MHDLKDKNQKFALQHKINIPLVFDACVIKEKDYYFTCSKESGVVHHKTTYDPIKEKNVITNTKVCSYLKVIARVRNNEGRSWGRVLQIYAGGFCHTWVIPAKILNDSRVLTKGLLDYGVDIETGRQINSLLLLYIKNAAKKIPAETCTKHLGWNDKSFVLPDKTLNAENETKVWYCPSSEHQIQNCYHQQGSLEDWKEHIGRLCIGNSRLILSVCISLAAPLLRIVGGTSMGFHFVGVSSIGKTGALQIAASVCGNPDYVKQWRHTCNAIEGVACFHNDSTLILDELSQASAKDFYHILYMLANGKGKSRAASTGMPKEVFNWSVLWLSSGEICLSGLLSEGGKSIKAGQQIRQLDIYADAGKGFGIFENIHNEKDSASFRRALEENTKKYYGTPFVEWLLILIKVKNNSLLQEELKQLYQSTENTLLAKYPQAEGQVRRVISGMSLLATAGEFASRHGITGWNSGEALNAIELIFTEYMNEERRNTTINHEAIKILKHVKLFFETYEKSAFIQVEKQNSKRVNIIKGYYENGTHGEYIFYMTPEQYECYLCQEYKKKTVTDVLLKNGWLIPSKESPPKPSQIKRFARLGKTIRVYVFDGKKIFETDIEQL